MKYLLSFAQEMEDIILYHMLRDVSEPIRWIDVGANDPIELSVTKFFENAGGGYGINIEPQKEYIKKLNADRPKDTNLAVGVGSENGTLELHGTGVMASFDSKNKWVQTVGKDLGSYSVPVVTLGQICRENLTEQDTIHFLKIDVEGWERECLLGMDFSRYRPWLICIESTQPETMERPWEQWESILLDQGYLFAGMSGINRYYVSEEQKSRAAEFRTLEELKAIYQIIPYSRAVEGIRKLDAKGKLWRDFYHNVWLSEPLSPVRNTYRTVKKRIRGGDQSCETGRKA